ncbi:MAG TPA: hypothetical protein VK176_10545, partial [Phycisphaerales bacterium]|nr:hypothetical protein [Phycisphaerales bacterium]
MTTRNTNAQHGQLLVLCAGLALLSSPALGQSLFQRSAEVPTAPDGKPDHQAPLRETSLTYSEAPPPRQIQINDLVTI